MRVSISRTRDFLLLEEVGGGECIQNPIQNNIGNSIQNKSIIQSDSGGLDER